jgi:hypothetical protein
MSVATRAAQQDGAAPGGVRSPRNAKDYPLSNAGTECRGAGFKAPLG